MLGMRRYFDPGSLAVIVVTLSLFLSAVVTKGLTHDILLEAAVFLVSVKLVIMAYKNVEATASVQKRLDAIYEKITAIESRPSQEG